MLPAVRVSRTLIAMPFQRPRTPLEQGSTGAAAQHRAVAVGTASDPARADQGKLPTPAWVRLAAGCAGQRNPRPRGRAIALKPRGSEENTPVPSGHQPLALERNQGTGWALIASVQS
jgi:hypothetical protein